MVNRGEASSIKLMQTTFCSYSLRNISHAPNFDPHTLLNHIIPGRFKILIYITITHIILSTLECSHCRNVLILQLENLIRYWNAQLSKCRRLLDICKCMDGHATYRRWPRQHVKVFNINLNWINNIEWCGVIEKIKILEHTWIEIKLFCVVSNRVCLHMQPDCHFRPHTHKAIKYSMYFSNLFQTELIDRILCDIGELWWCRKFNLNRIRTFACHWDGWNITASKNRNGYWYIELVPFLWWSWFLNIL